MNNDNELYNVMRELYPQLKQNEILYDKVKTVVYNFDKQYEIGFTNEEIDVLLKENYSNINMEKFENALNGITMYINPETHVGLIYDIDIVKGIICGIQNRELTAEEWD